HSRRELARKLLAHTDQTAEVEALLDDLQREGWLSNERFAQSLLNRRAPRMGTGRILNELRQHGVDEDTVADLGQQLHDSELDRARAVWEKKFGQLPRHTKDYARQY